MTEVTPDQRPLASNWVPFTDTKPRCGEVYWLLNTLHGCMLAHLDNEGRWRSIDVNGDVFDLEDTYTHWDLCREPAVYE